MRTSRRGRLAFVIGGGLILGSFAFGAVDIGTAEPVSTAVLPQTTTSTTVEFDTTSTVSVDQPTPPTASESEIMPGPSEPVRRPLVIHAVGDVALDPDYIVEFQSEGYAYAFAELGDLFRNDDLTVINLECTPSTLGSPLDKTFVFRCPPSALTIARSHGVDVVNLANNHSQDYGKAAMLDGVLQARLAGLRPVGVGTDVASATASQLIEAGGWTIAVLGMGGVIPGETWLATDDRPGMASGDDIEQMTAAIRAADEVADLVFVSIHWGVEGEAAPREDDRERARAMVEAGADAIFGHHPHRLGALELVDGTPVYWTLGNFIWPRLSDASATTGVARVEVSGEGDVTACLLPAFIARGGQPTLTGAQDCGSAP